MRASMLLRSAAKGSGKASGPSLFPAEVYPLFICMGLVTIAAGYRMVGNYMHEEVRAGHQDRDTARLPSADHH